MPHVVTNGRSTSTRRLTSGAWPGGIDQPLARRDRRGRASGTYGQVGLDWRPELADRLDRDAVWLLQQIELRVTRNCLALRVEQQSNQRSVGRGTVPARHDPEVA